MKTSADVWQALLYQMHIRDGALYRFIDLLTYFPDVLNSLSMRTPTKPVSI